MTLPKITKRCIHCARVFRDFYPAPTRCPRCRRSIGEGWQTCDCVRCHTRRALLKSKAKLWLRLNRTPANKEQGR